MSIWNGRKGEIDSLLDENEKMQEHFAELIKCEQVWLKRYEVRIKGYQQKIDCLKEEAKILNEEFHRTKEDVVSAS